MYCDLEGDTGGGADIFAFSFLAQQIQICAVCTEVDVSRCQMYCSVTVSVFIRHYYT